MEESKEESSNKQIRTPLRYAREKEEFKIEPSYLKT